MGGRVGGREPERCQGQPIRGLERKNDRSKGKAAVQRNPINANRWEGKGNSLDLRHMPSLDSQKTE